MKRLSELVKVFDLEPIEVSGGEALRFRLEVARALDEAVFLGTVYRLETYRLQPTFPQSDGEVPDLKNDALLFVVDEALSAEPFAGGSIQDVVDKFLGAVERVFGTGP